MYSSQNKGKQIVRYGLENVSLWMQQIWNSSECMGLQSWMQWTQNKNAHRKSQKQYKRLSIFMIELEIIKKKWQGYQQMKW